MTWPPVQSALTYEAYAKRPRALIQINVRRSRLRADEVIQLIGLQF
jgi:hypothetical protein